MKIIVCKFPLGGGGGAKPYLSHGLYGEGIRSRDNIVFRIGSLQLQQHYG